MLVTSASVGQTTFFGARSSEGGIWRVWCCSTELAEMRRASALGDGKAGIHSSGSLQGQAPWVGVSCREDAHLLQTLAFP